MSDSEYESEDDEDYIPEEPSSEEDVDLEGEIVEKKRKKINKPTSRKRKGGIRLEDDEEASNHEERDNEIEGKLEEEDTQVGEKEKLTSKQKEDNIWAAFKEETAAVRPATSSNIINNAGKKIYVKSGEGEVKAVKSSAVETKDKETPKKVEITEIFDFAGEEVKVVKSVDASSVKPAVSSNESNDAIKAKTAVLIKRPGGGLGTVLGKIGKKPKLSTLEKSKLDWNSFKKEEGIEDELKTSNRDGYLEKQAFLSRVDHKQFEHERDIRQGFRKR